MIELNPEFFLPDFYSVLATVPAVVFKHMGVRDAQHIRLSQEDLQQSETKGGFRGT